MLKQFSLKMYKAGKILKDKIVLVAIKKKLFEALKWKKQKSSS